MIDPVTGKKEGMKAREKRKVAQRGQVVIREVNYILVLEGISTRPRQKPVCPNAISGDTEKQQHSTDYKHSPWQYPGSQLRGSCALDISHKDINPALVKM